MHLQKNIFEPPLIGPILCDIRGKFSMHYIKMKNSLPSAFSVHFATENAKSPCRRFHICPRVLVNISRCHDIKVIDHFTNA